MLTSTEGLKYVYLNDSHISLSVDASLSFIPPDFFFFPTPPTACPRQLSIKAFVPERKEKCVFTLVIMERTRETKGNTE